MSQVTRLLSDDLRRYSPLNTILLEPLVLRKAIVSLDIYLRSQV